MDKWKKAILILKVVEVRLRFIAVLAVTAAAIGYWDTIANYWEKWTRPTRAVATATAAGNEYYCPMHPQVIRDGLEPNGEVPKCPICGMPLSLRKKGVAAPLPSGVTGRVQFSPERIALAGIKTSPIKYQKLSQRLDAVGNVAYDESRLSRIVSRTGGYVEKLYLDKTYLKVRRGDPLAELYSPELYATCREYLLAKERDATDLAERARRRLRLLGVDQQDIDAMAASGKAGPTIVIRSPRDGYVVNKLVVKGSRVDEGMTLFEVADLSTVWIEADVYERDIPFVHVGQKVTASVDALPDQTFDGRVANIYPQVDAAARTNRVRLEIANPSASLHPGMFATVQLETPLDKIEPFKFMPAHNGEFLAVPETAVVDSGARQVVYVERSPGVFEGIEVTLGPRIGEVYPVIDGLEAGQRIATSGSFLIDAETRLNPAAASTYVGGRK